MPQLHLNKLHPDPHVQLPNPEGPFLTLREIAESTANAIAFQQRSLDSLTKVFLDNIIALDYLLTEQGGICAIVNNTCCTWVNISGEVETQLHEVQR